MMGGNVWLFYPNVIGYMRIVLALVSFEAMSYAPLRAILCYVISAALDAVDGYVARKYNQSKFSSQVSFTFAFFGSSDLQRPAHTVKMANVWVML